MRATSSKRIVKLTLFCMAWILPVLALAGDKKDEKKEEKPKKPEVKSVVPLAVPLGETRKVTVRGLDLESATAIQFQDSAATAKNLAAKKADVPRRMSREEVGDTEVEFELNLPAAASAGELKFTILTPHGETGAVSILIAAKDQLTQEAEPNDGFSTAQPISIGATVLGSIHQARNVDVFRFQAPPGAKLVFEVRAADVGSPLDPVLTLHDTRGRVLKMCDDVAESRDCKIEMTLSVEDFYLLSVLDARDFGSPAHAYRLQVRTAD